MTAPLSHEELIDWIRLTRTPGIGPKTFRQLLQRFGAVGEALAQRHVWEKQAAGDVPTPQAAEREFAASEKAGLRYLPMTDPAYPAPLAALEDPPPLLFVKGKLEALSVPLIAVVGARNATVNGRKFAKMLSGGLAKAGYGVISGMARGIDGAAHEGALSQGITVAVLAGGPDVIYPPEHRDLYERIAEHGAIISEMPPGTEPQASLFPRRNRIISGASVGVVVVEATLRSGSLITARFAADQGRDVFAVPGSPLDPRAEGPNTLIREGATLVQSLSDIIDEMRVKPVVTHKISSPPEAIRQATDIPTENSHASLHQRIEAALGPTPAAVDELIRQCQVSPAVLAAALMEMELAGRLERLPGNRVALIGTV